MSELMHYGSHGGAECGAHGDGRVPESQLTKDPALVTCRTCRGWLPLVHNWKPAESASSATPSARDQALAALVARWTAGRALCRCDICVTRRACADDVRREVLVSPSTPPEEKPTSDSIDVQRLIAIYHEAAQHWNAQSFDFTSAPESMRRRAHEAAREGFRELREALSPLVMPTLKAEFAEASRLARVSPSTPNKEP